SASERRVIFSVWDAGNEATDRSKVADSNKVELLAKGEDVFADGFGNEGTGGHSHWIYPWKTDQTYRFLVTATPDSAARKTIYSGYFFVPDLQRWKLIASFRAPRDGQGLRNLYSFNENFDGSNAQLQREAFFGNQWIQRQNNTWLELEQASFSYDATAKAGDRIDYGGGVSPDGRFYLWNGGFQPANAAYGDVFKRPARGQRPLLELAKNVDSLAQAARDRQEILAAIAAGKLDTTGSKEGVYYQLLQQGNGEQIEPTDTISVFYKGTLMDGSVFGDATGRPSNFPLRRLVRGWQIVLPMYRVGSKVRLIIPSGIAYGIQNRSKAIPPNRILIFDIELLGTKKMAPATR
ncbi:MAG: DUF3472 domain-containing protein, partial [Chitinophagaceae bacterium]|nr:DUF3472 domain-containing protein [Chitinophagaceae bacterium]